MAPAAPISTGTGTIRREKGIPLWVLALAMICDTMMIAVLAALSISRIWAA